jgi:signal transduction histidine kinase
MLVTYVTLLAVVLAGLTIPLGLTITSRDTQTMFIDRVNDTARFASLAEEALRTERTEALRAELRLYESLFAIRTAIVGRDGGPLLTSPAPPAMDSTVRARIDAALTGQRSAVGGVIWPWRAEPLVVAEPIVRGGEVIGAAVTVSPTNRLRAVTWRQWAVLAALGVLVLLVGAAAAGPLTGWMIRPVHELDRVAHALTAGDLDARVPAGSGPPELRRLATSFNTMAERLAMLIERQRTFVSYASHQLRTPLGTLRLSVDNLAPSVTRAGRADHEMVVDEIKRLTDICDALLAFASADVTAAEPADIDVAAVASSRVAAWAPVAAQAGVQLAGAGAPAALARAAPGVVDQALDALVDNAIKFAGAGARVTVAARHGPRGWVDLHVLDDGPGMSNEDLARATEPFWRAARNQNVKGSGLGVTIANALIVASGGSLTLTIAPPHGIDARIRLPATTERGDDERAALAMELTARSRS